MKRKLDCVMKAKLSSCKRDDSNTSRACYVYKC